MSLPRRRAPEAVYELIDLLKLAHGAVNRAQLELQGEASNLASRLSSQLVYLRGVSELLEHEATRCEASGSSGQLDPRKRLSKSARLPIAAPVA